jgi:hypothetical protein
LGHTSCRGKTWRVAKFSLWQIALAPSTPIFADAHLVLDSLANQFDKELLDFPDVPEDMLVCLTDRRLKSDLRDEALTQSERTLRWVHLLMGLAPAFVPTTHTVSPHCGKSRAVASILGS